MIREITQRELRNESGAIMRGLDRGEEFVVTRNGIPVGELRPYRRRYVARARLLDALARAAAVGGQQFRDDLDAVAGQDIEPRA
jgi:antitoxin (DNA-binding transcriptional repressor) of toxin-antitoxin stability system